jgi:hypothetical protein
MNAVHREIIVAWLALLCMVAVSGAEEQVGGIAGQVGVTVTIQPYMAVSVQVIGDTPSGTTDETDGPIPGVPPLRGGIDFKALKQPGVVDGDGHIVITVWTNSRTWSVLNETSGLQSPEDFIPPERLFVRSHFTDPTVDQGAGVGYESMVSPKLVAGGAVAEHREFEVHYRLEATWEDKPGLYQGVLTFTILPTP